MTDQATKSREWREQWSLFQDNERFLFEEWIAPVTLGDLAGKAVLEAGCGGGQHTSFMAPVAESIVAVDLNTADIAQERNRQFGNVRFVDADVASMDLGRQFDAVICIGVIHHTDDPDRTFANLYTHLKSGGKMVIWTYSSEGNRPVRFLIEPIRRLLLRHLPRSGLVLLSQLVTAGLYPPVYTVYRLPFLTFLPYYDYFRNFRRLSFGRNVLNVFDKLNAPQTRFTTLSKCIDWFGPDRFEPASISIRRHLGVSYSLSGTRRIE
jgi:SAM-dependent methyltransferase